MLSSHQAGIHSSGKMLCKEGLYFLGNTFFPFHNIKNMFLM